jgi:hypothetical protein
MLIDYGGVFIRLECLVSGRLYELYSAYPIRLPAAPVSVATEREA